MPDNRQSDIEAWFLSHVETVLRTQPSCERTPACVEDNFLADFARSTQKFSLSDSRVEHVTSCAYCMRRFLETRDRQRALLQGGKNQRNRKRWVIAASLGGCLVILIVSAFLLIMPLRRTPSPSQVAEVQRTIDLTNHGTYRGGETVPLQAVSLPPALVHLEIVLPRFSDPGNYTVSVLADKQGTRAVASANGVATGANPRTVLKVTLDLRSAKSGLYFLSTSRESEGGPYYYPLKIQ
jgi:hypothetical protein